MNNLPQNPLGQPLIQALIARFEAERTEAYATIQLYLMAPVGVGDHPTIVEDLAKATSKMAEAEEALESLTRNFLAPSGRPPTPSPGFDDEQ